MLEIIEAARAHLGRDVPYSIGPRRAGDPPALTADALLARNLLGWNPNARMQPPSLPALGSGMIATDA